MKVHLVYISLLVLSFLLETPNASARELASTESDLFFERFSPESGLSSPTVTDILQDRYDFMWIGTVEGLNRFDAYNFTEYLHDPYDSSTLSGDCVTSILEDDEGTIWIGTDRGLNRYRPETDDFIRYMHDPNDPLSLGADHVTRVIQDRNGRIWLSTNGGGLNRFDKETETFTRYQANPENPNGISSNFVAYVYEDRSGVLWVGTRYDTKTENKGLSRFDPETATFTRVPLTGVKFPYPEILSIYVDRSGELWLTTWLDGLYRYNPNTQSVKEYLHDPNDPNTPSSDIITSIYEFEPGLFWLGTRNGGMSIFDKEAETFRRVPSNDANQSGLSDKSVICIKRDRSGGVWVGTLDTGLCRYDEHQNQFRHYKNDDKNIHSLNNNKIYAMCADASGTIWIGTDGGGLNKFDPETESFTHYKNDPNNLQSISSDSVISLFPSRQGILWVGAWNGAFDRFDAQTGTFTHYGFKNRSPNALQGRYFRDVCENASGYLWIGTEYCGLSRFDPSTGKAVQYAPDPNDPSSFPCAFVRSVYCDSAGVLWAGTESEGLVKYIPDEDCFQTYRFDPDDRNGISSNHVTDIYEDSRNRFWICTDRGVNRLDRRTMEFQHIAMKDGLPDNAVKSVLEDGDGYLWFSTNNGISRYDPSDDSFINFGESNGLQSLIFNIGASCVGSDGNLYFGGMNGFNRIQPNRIKRNPHVPRIAITSVDIMGKPIIHNPYALDRETLDLDYFQNFITFRFSALNYSQATNNQYAYKIAEIESDWNYCGANREARYTTLSPGEYTFLVKGSNNDSLWNEEGASFHFVITPPFWQTQWFKIAVLLFAAGGLFLLHTRRIRFIQKHRKQLMLEVQNQTEEIVAKSKALEASNRELERLTLVDGLTGVSNRRCFDRHYENEWKRSLRKSTPITVVMIDIDYFKKYNDAFGHNEGDRTLISIANTLNLCVHRPGDIVARFGGEEFICLLADTIEANGAKLAEIMRRAVEDLCIPHAEEVEGPSVTISLGLATFTPTPHVQPKQIIERADIALYEAKSKGRNCVRVYREETPLA